jgi:hypothetical protein
MTTELLSLDPNQDFGSYAQYVLAQSPLDQSKPENQIQIVSWKIIKVYESTNPSGWAGRRNTITIDTWIQPLPVQVASLMDWAGIIPETSMHKGLKSLVWSQVSILLMPYAWIPDKNPIVKTNPKVIIGIRVDE